MAIPQKKKTQSKYKKVCNDKSHIKNVCSATLPIANRDKTIGRRKAVKRTRET